MNDELFAPAQAPRYVAVGQLQKLAARARRNFYQDRYLRAADNILSGIIDAPPDPDLLSLGQFTRREIEKAIEPPQSGECVRATVLREAAAALRSRSITNVKKTVSRRHKAQKPLDDQAPTRDVLQDVENRLDCEILLEFALPKQQVVLKYRLEGLDDDEIALKMNLSRGNVAVIAHRGCDRIRRSHEYDE